MTSVESVFASDVADLDPVRMTAWVRGRVQGVGMRWWIRARALELGLTGSASNLDDGRVEVIAEGSRADCRRLADLLVPDAAGATDVPSNQQPSRPGHVSGLVLRLGAPRGTGPGFRER